MSAATRNLTLPLTAVRATAAETNEWKCNYSNEDADLPAISQSDKSANVDVVLNDETLCSYDETLARSVSGFYLVIARTRDAVRLASVVVSCPHLQRSYDETLGSYDETLFFLWRSTCPYLGRAFTAVVKAGVAQNAVEFLPASLARFSDAKPPAHFRCCLR